MVQSTQSTTRPMVAITQGDASGIGPEIIAKLLSGARVHECCRPVVVGDAEVCMYHAQSNVPVKLIDFGAGYSATCGLDYPLVTTAHGTGFDIAGRNLASERSLSDALNLAIQFAMAGRTS